MKLMLLTHFEKLNNIAHLFLKGSGSLQFQVLQFSGWKGAIYTVTIQDHSLFNSCLQRTGVNQRTVKDVLCKLLLLLVYYVRPHPQNQIFWSRVHYLYNADSQLPAVKTILYLMG